MCVFVCVCFEGGGVCRCFARLPVVKWPDHSPGSQAPWDGRLAACVSGVSSPDKTLIDKGLIIVSVIPPSPWLVYGQG